MNLPLGRAPGQQQRVAGCFVVILRQEVSSIDQFSVLSRFHSMHVSSNQVSVKTQKKPASPGQQGG
jgi:hypothetical protein